MEYLNKIFRILFSSKILLAILVITVVVFVASMWHRFIYIDDCWHGEEAYWLAHDGVVKTKSMQGILGFENKVMVYHKFNILLGALVIKLFGWSVYYLKLITLFFYLSFFYLLNRYMKRFSSQFSKEHFLLSVVFIFASPLMVYLGFTYRPEILAMFFGFLSYFTLTLYLDTGLKKWVIAAGLTAGMAFFTHLNAMIFGIAGFVLLLLQRKPKALGLFTLFAFLTSFLYTFDLWQGDNYQVFRYQLDNWPTLKLGKTYLDNGLLNFLVLKGENLLNEHQRFFWSDKVMAFSALFFILVIARFKFLITHYRVLMIYTLTLILSLNITGSHIAERFLIYYYPFMAIICAIAIGSLMEEDGKKLLKGVIALTFAVQLVLLGLRFQDIFRQNADYPAIHRQLSALINDPGTKVLAPDRYVFNEIENRPVLSYHAWEYYEDIHNTKLSALDALTLADKLGAKYIILDEDKQAPDNPLFANGFIPPNPYFEMYKKWDGYLILKKSAH